MAGCFGNHPYDRDMERQLDRYLKTLEDNEFAISGTITYLDANKVPVVVNVDEDSFETRFEASNEVREAFIASYCKDNGIDPASIEDYDLSISPDSD